MNWRLFASIGISLILRLLIRAKLGWTDHPYTGGFNLTHIGRDLTVTLFILAVVLSVINAIVGPPPEE